MNISKFIFRTLIGITSFVTIASAFADEIKMGTPVYGGNGCPNGTAQISLSNDNELSLLFDSFTAEAGGSSGKTIDRKACNLAVPIHVPQGLSVSLLDVTYRGFNSIPRGGRSQFNSELFFAGSQGPRFSKTFLGLKQGDFEIKTAVAPNAMIWSPCGQDVIFRSNTSLLATTNRRAESALSSIESARYHSGVTYQLQFRTCTP